MATSLVKKNGTSGSETIAGTRAGDVMHGYAGNDTLYGDGGDDWLFGDSGNDWLFGGRGKDTLIGDFGNDTLDGGTGADSMVGGAGSNMFYVDDAGDKIMRAKRGDTIFVYESGFKNTNIAGWINSGATVNFIHNAASGPKEYSTTSNDIYQVTSSSDSISDTSGNDTVWISGGCKSYDMRNQAAGVETLIYKGTPGKSDPNFKGIGNTLANLMIGGKGADSLYGDLGLDTLDGGAGNDTLDGGAGYANDTRYKWDDDVLTGGDGSDTFVFTKNWRDNDGTIHIDSGNIGHDIVTDFDCKHDKLLISKKLIAVTGRESDAELLDLFKKYVSTTYANDVKFCFDENNSIQLNNIKATSLLTANNVKFFNE